MFYRCRAELFNTVRCITWFVTVGGVMKAPNPASILNRNLSLVLPRYEVSLAKNTSGGDGCDNHDCHPGREWWFLQSQPLGRWHQGGLLQQRLQPGGRGHQRPT